MFQRIGSSAMLACTLWLAAGGLGTAAATLVSVQVFAQGNSSSGAGVDLDTGIDLVSGDRLVSSVDPLDCWSAGADPRVSNANGLNGLSPAPCQPTSNFGLYSQDGESFPYGALVGRIDASDWFMLGTSFDAVVPYTGRLFLVYWDSNSSDNSGSVTARIEVNPAQVPLPGSLALAVAGLALLTVRRRRRLH